MCNVRTKKHCINWVDLSDPCAGYVGLLYENKTSPPQKPGCHKVRFPKNEVKVNIEFTDACKNHASGTVGGCDLRHLSIKTHTYCELQKSTAGQTQVSCNIYKE